MSRATRMIFFALLLTAVVGSTESHSVQKYVNPCGAVYVSVVPNLHGVRKVFHQMKPYLMDLIHILKSSHHKFMEEYTYKKTWVPDENTLILTNNGLNSAKQLPEIYRGLQYFSYALDIVQEDALSTERSENCFFIIDSMPKIIEKHQQLICAVDVAMGQLNVEVPVVKSIELPEEWVNPNDKSCTHRFFRFSEVHTKYRKFLHSLFHLAHI